MFEDIIPEQFTAIGPPSIIWRGGGGGTKKSGNFPEVSAWGVFVRKFHGRFRPEEFSSAGDLLWRHCTQLHLKGRGLGGGGEGRGGAKKLINKLLLYYCSSNYLRRNLRTKTPRTDASGKCSSILFASKGAKNCLIFSHSSANSIYSNLLHCAIMINMGKPGRVVVTILRLLCIHAFIIIKQIYGQPVCSLVHQPWDSTSLKLSCWTYSCCC